MALAAANVPLADPPGSSVLGAAVAWVQAALLGTVATVFAILAVAAVGAAMLTGRIRVRPALTVVLGCFILFGAASIVQGIRTVLGAGETQAELPAQSASEPPAVAPEQPPGAQADPYAGAAVPAE